LQTLSIVTGEAESSSGREAAAWFVSLRDSEATEGDRARFAAWLEADPRNRHAWRELETIWAAMDSLAPPEAGAHPSPVTISVVATTDQASGWMKWYAAAAIFLLVGFAGFWAVQSPGSLGAMFASYTCGPEHGRDVTLPDGSVATLGASSALSVDFDEKARRVVLHRGESYFSVSSDPGRPFVVETANGTVTAVGTEFVVKRADDLVTVAVASGTVAVAAGSGAPIRLSPGERAQYSAAGLGPVEAVDIANIGSWREGRLTFDSVPLGEVLADLERYRRGRILVTDSDLAALPVTGVFDLRRGDAALETIARTLPVTVTYVTDLLVLVSPRR
jgi:transmembrane sensor